MSGKVISLAEFKATQEALEGASEAPQPFELPIDLNAVDAVHRVLTELLETGQTDAYSMLQAIVVFGGIAEEVWPHLEAVIETLGDHSEH